ncbi:hypothetical protein [Geobacter sp. FeAm09]|uniref:hypothetical protein n=1 Tax=Geobacter sp. FeAm09 TaxID=2597769 RepID=UPI001F0EA80C|nr:hypothetical protein [Geobacter sp. FeAm09]
MAQDADFIAEITTLAREFTGHETAIRIKAIRPETGETPRSLAEKKKSDDERLMADLKREVAEHPVINEAARIFGGTVMDIRKA